MAGPSSLDLAASWLNPYLSIPCLITWRFRRKPASSSPAPLPQSVSTGRSSSTQARAVPVVVLPIPISPAASRRTPRPAASAARSYPNCIVCSVWLLLMAGSTRKSLDPFRTLPVRIPSTSSSIPTSTGQTLIPALRAIRQTVDCDFAIFLATAAVTEASVCVTPSSTIPLSAQNTYSSAGERSTSADPCMPAMSVMIFSSSPSPSSGLAMESHLARALSAALLSQGAT